MNPTLKINLANIDGVGTTKYNVKQVKLMKNAKDVIRTFLKVFHERVGKILNAKFRQGANEINHIVHYKKKCDDDITEISTNGWGSPLVVIPKPVGNVRLHIICGLQA